MKTKYTFSARSRSLVTVVLSALVLTAAATLAGPVEAQEKISPKLAKPMKAAQEAILKKQWDQALVKIDEAEKIPGRTPFDQHQINEFKGYVWLQQKKYADVARVYEANLNSGFLPADQVDDRLRALVQLNTATRNYPKVIELGDRWLKTGGQDIDTRILIAQAHYLQKGYKDAISVMQGVIKSAEQTGRTVDENWLQLVRSSQQNINDIDGASKTLEKLVRLYPKPEYWDFLLGSRMRQKNSDRVLLNLYRLADEVGVLNNPDEYVELTEMLLEVGLPGEAKSVMESGYQAKVFETTDKARADRYSRRLNEATSAATKDQQSLPAIEKEAQKSQTGQSSVALGMAYSSFGQYDKAVAALTQGLEKGGVRDPEQAQIMLGIANLKLGKKAEAVKAFEQIAATSDMSDVARLWTIVARSGTG